MNLKALSLTQPYASAIAFGTKHFETRSWHTTYRGPLAIHAAKAFPKWAKEFAEEEGMRAAELPLGAILCVCELTDCRLTSVVEPTIGEIERKYGDYGDGRYAFKLENVRVLETPVPCRGALGIWEVPDDILKAICERVPKEMQWKSQAQT